MSRRALFGSFVGIGLASPAVHEHSWHAGPFYLTAAITYEEPGYYPPGGIVPVETCDCGAIRLPDGLGKLRKKYMTEPAP